VGWANALGGLPAGDACPPTFGPKNSSDCTPFVQAALNSGANTVYFPAGLQIPIYGTLMVPRAVRRIVGHAVRR